MPLDSLAPFPPNIPVPDPLSEEEARDPVRLADWLREFSTVVKLHGNAVRTYLGNLEPSVNRVESRVTVNETNITSNQSSITTLESNSGSSGGDLGTPAWEWNGTDTSQFESTASWTSGTVTPNLQVVASANVNQKATNYLEASSTGNGTGGFGYFIKDELNFTGTSRDIVLEWITAPGSTTQYGGFSILADNTGASHAYNVFIGPGGLAGWRSQVDNGTATIPGTTVSRIWDGSGECRGRIWVRGIKPSSAVPRFHSLMESVPGNGGVASYSVRLDKRSDFPNEPPGSTWNSLGCKKVGISVQASGGNPYGSFRITEMRVYLL